MGKRENIWAESQCAEIRRVETLDISLVDGNIAAKRNIVCLPKEIRADRLELAKAN